MKITYNPPVSKLDMIAGDDNPTRWNAPAYGTPEFEAYLEGRGLSLEEFKATTQYKNAVKRGLIADDVWQGDSAPFRQ